MSKSFYKWDKHSDQPHVLRDKSFKKKLYKQGAVGTIKTLLSALLLPFFALISLFQRRTLIGKSCNSIGLCVNPDYPLEEKYSPNNSQIRTMVDELGVDNLLIRIPLADWKNKKKYYDLIELFADKNVLINILQDRDHIDNTKKTEQALTEIFQRFSPITDTFQIGNTVNRKKWGFTSLDEYFAFFKLAQNIKYRNFPNIQLLGGNIIDFELPFFVRSLIHGWPIHYDGVAAQLYVDRRGAPEKTQLACDTIAKINWFHRIMRWSWKSQNKLYITEVNWPLEGTSPYAPAVGDCMVSETLQTTYLVRYYLLMMASGRVEKCYWHQLIAPGYGLVDNLGSELRKRDAYYSFKVMTDLLTQAKTQYFSERKQQYRLGFSSPRGNIEAIWACDKSFLITITNDQYVIDLLGNTIQADENGKILISDQVVYILDFPY